MTRDTVTVPREAWAEVRHFVECRATDSGTTRDLLNRIDVAAPSSDPEGGARGVQGSIATKQESCPESAPRTGTAIVAALRECQRVLAMMIDPAQIKTTSSMQAWSAAVQAETKARRLLDEVARQDESQAKATEGKAGMAVGTPHVRLTTAGTGLRVGAADAVQPATSEIMDVTAGETAPNSKAVAETDSNAPGDTSLVSGVSSAPNHQPHAVSQGWQGIETAPKDGTRIIAVGWNWGIVGNDQHVTTVIWRLDREEWCESDDDDDDSACAYLTHWMPLPAPPSPAKTGGVE